MKRIFVIVFIVSELIFAKDAVIIKVNRPGQLIFEISIDSTWISSEDQLIRTFPSLDTYFQPGFPIIPYYREVFIGVPANAVVQMFNDKVELVDRYIPNILGPERAKGMEFELPVKSRFDSNFPKQNVKLISIRNVNGVPSSKIEVFPFSIQDDQLFVIKNMSVQITWDTNIQSSPVKILSKIPPYKLQAKRRLKGPIENTIPEYQFSNNIARIVVDTSAWYRINNSALLLNGIDLTDVNPNTIRLWNKEDEISLYIETGNDGSFNNEDMIVFYGEKNPSPEGTDYDNNFYTDDNAYWLTWNTGEGKRFSEMNVSPDQPDSIVYIPKNYIFNKKVERDDVYVRLNRLNQYLLQTWDVIDHFFMSPQVIVSKPFDFEFELDNPDTLYNKGFELEVQVRGMTTSEHDLDIKLNSYLITNAKWTDRNALHIERSNINSSYLKNGKNTLSLILSPDDSTLHDLIYLNWYKIKYPRYFQTDNDYIYFSADSIPDQTIQFEITGFSNSDILLFKDRETLLSNYQISYDNQSNDYLLKFQVDDVTLMSQFEAISYENLLNVKSITLESAIINPLNNIRSSYIVIAPDSFATILAPLVEYHNGALVNVDDIYRQYSFGVLSPYAIKSFLNDIYQQNGTKLKYALIAMQSNLNDWRRGIIGKPPSIPAMSIYTYNMGTVACDYWYSVFDDEYWIPNISVSRFPVSNRSELQTIVDKTIYYLNRDISNWDNNSLLIGGAEAGFRYQSEAMVNRIKNNGTFLSRLYTAPSIPDSSFYGAKDTLMMHLNRGLAYINFVGHGGGAVWADNHVLHRNDMEEISNYNKLPFITSMTCFTGDFSFSYGLGRLMLANENGGAIAWYGASGLGWYYNDYYMVQPLQNLLFSDDDLTIGEIINLSKTQYFLSYSNIYPEIAASQIYQYNLIGDPAIKVKKPIQDNVKIVPLDPEPGEDIEISSNKSQSDSIFYQIFLPNNCSRNQSTLLGNSLPEILALPDTFSQGMHSINVSFKSNDALYNSSQLLSISGSYVKIDSTIPATPTLCDSINVIAYVSDRNGISSVKLIWDSDYWADMISVDTNYYSLEKLIPPQPSGTVLNLVCQVIDSNNDTTNSIPEIINISDIPNISPTKGEFRIDDDINLVVDIESTTTTPVTANVELFILDDDSWQLIGRDTVNFFGMENKEATFPGYYPFGTNHYKVVTNANLTCMSTDLVTDDTLTFNIETTAFWVTPELGSTDDGITHSKIGIANIEIEIPAGLVSESSIMQIYTLTDVDLSSQPDFNVFQSEQDNLSINIIWESTSIYDINWRIGNLAVQSHYNLYKYFDEFGIWLPVIYTEASDSTIVFASSGSTKLAFLENKDVEKPVLTATINGQQFLRNSYLNTNPAIQFTAYDKNGIDYRSDSISFWINRNNRKLSSEINGNGNSINLIINPILTKFDSTMAILVQDAAGNSSDTLQLSFIVSEKLDLINYGNYPNPFAESTIFAYELTDAVEKLTITIYSVEGRRIRRLDNDDIVSGANINSAGYHEVEWDGKNQDGIPVGNGNYFYQIRAKNNRIIKLSLREPVKF
ncbi:MAG: T9SS type A sorting domain-containing protein [Planctomycetia bacterium]|nr:T9SS type A sorting domain-containing protein [Planctomycetia bacterium]